MFRLCIAFYKLKQTFATVFALALSKCQILLKSSNFSTLKL